MILCELEEAYRYVSLNTRFQDVLNYLSQITPAWEVGRHEIPDTDCFVIVASDLGRGKSESPLEIHRKYVDIQLVLEGKELIGWQALSLCRNVTEAYDESRDIAFYGDLPQTWLSIRPGQCAFFFPEDAHAPLAGSGPVMKAVAKIPV